MGDSITPNVGLVKPEVGASDDLWGEKLNANFDKIDTAVGPAPVTKPYVDAQDSLRVLKSGDTMSGFLILVGPPTANLHAATKAYVDTKAVGDVTKAYVDAQDLQRILKTGDVMTGFLTLSGEPFAPLHAATKSYVDSHSGGGSGGVSISVTDIPPSSPTDGSLWWENDTGVLWIYYNDGNTQQWVQAAPGQGAVSADLALKVSKSGDTMSGNLTITKANPIITLDKTTTSGQVNGINGLINGNARWGMQLGDSSAESGLNVGSDFRIQRFDDAGNFINLAFHMKRDTGNVSFGGVNPAAYTAYGSDHRILNITSNVGGNKIAVLDLAGNATVGFPVGQVIFTNQASPDSDKRIGAIGVSRTTANNTSSMDFSVWNAGAIVVPLILTPVAVNITLGIASTSPTTGALTVAGGVGIGGALNVGGSVSVGGARAYFIDDAGLAWGAQTTMLIGNAAIGIIDAYIANIQVLRIAGPVVQIHPTTTSSSPTTGALTVAGGVGIGGAINVVGAGSFGGNINVNGGTVQIGNGVNTLGLLRIDGAGGTTSGGQILFVVGGVARFVMGNASSITGGAQNDDFLFWMSNASPNSAIRINAASSAVVFGSTVPSTSPTTGALVVNGGVGIAGNLHAATIGVGVAAGSSPGNGNTTTGTEVAAGIINISLNAGPGLNINTNSDGFNTGFRRSGTLVGSVTVTATATAFNTSSDERLKEDLKLFDGGKLIDRIDVFDFRWKSTQKRDFGVIAQRVNHVYPNAITHIKDTWGVDYSKFVPLLLQEIKDLRSRVKRLEH